MTHSILGEAMSPERYAGDWQADSSAIEGDGLYSWMSEQLGSHEVVLEVGCGSGRSSAVLADKSRVVSVEPNPTMANFALQYLQRRGISVAVAQELPQPLQSQVTIVIDDIFTLDSQWLRDVVHPAAMACWLIGAEPGRIENHLGRPLKEIPTADLADYRKDVHKRCYQLGKESMQSGGVVHTVDRIVISSWNEKDAFRKGLVKLHQGLASDAYEVEFKDALLKRYRPQATTSSIKVGLSGHQGHIPALGSTKASLR